MLWEINAPAGWLEYLSLMVMAIPSSPATEGAISFAVQKNQGLVIIFPLDTMRVISVPAGTSSSGFNTLRKYCAQRGKIIIFFLQH
jgi:hypothetical protein